jgi:SAM-dependent methyltransferase
MIRVSKAIQDRVTASYGAYFEPLCKVPADKLAADVLNEEKVHDQVALLCKTLGISAPSLRGKRVLEVGSGFGIFVAVTRTTYGAESTGLEPAVVEGFDSSYQTSRAIVAEYGVEPDVICNARGEAIPFPDDHFDLAFSSTALEHSDDPERVLNETMRVLKPGGCLHFVFPNYGSFFEGHYALPWLPHLPLWLARLWVRLWGRDPAFLETLRFTNYFRTRRWIAQRDDVEVVTLGEKIFAERMAALSLKDWGGLGRVQHALDVARRLHVVPLVTWLCLRTKSFDPIVLTLRKQAAMATPRADNQVIYDTNWPQWLDMKRFGPSSRWLRALIGDLIDGSLRGATVKRVLDFGCGEGTTTAFLADRFPGAQVLGVDQSGSGIHCATSQYAAPNLAYRHVPGDPAFRDGDFDLVCCFEVLEHVDDWQALAHELARATSRYLMVSFPTGRMRGFEVKVGHLRNFRRGEFESFMERIGFRAVESFQAGFPFYSPLFRDLCELTGGGDDGLTQGRYSFWKRRMSDAIFASFRHCSTRKRGGDQFCGLFERIGSDAG